MFSTLQKNESYDPSSFMCWRDNLTVHRKYVYCYETPSTILLLLYDFHVTTTATISCLSRGTILNFKTSTFRGWRNAIGTTRPRHLTLIVLAFWPSSPLLASGGPVGVVSIPASDTETVKLPASMIIISKKGSFTKSKIWISIHLHFSSSATLQSPLS